MTNPERGEIERGEIERGEVREDYTITLRARTPVHVGGAGGDGTVDMAPATDGQGRLIVPGSSWAGVLRALLRRTAPGSVVDAVFGPPTAPGESGGHASRLSVFDSVLDTPDLTVRTGVQIHRRTGTAAPGLLYDRLVLPPGQVLVLRLRYEGPTEPAVRDLVATVRAHGLTVGAASSRGLGRLDCVDACRVSVNLHNASALCNRLAGRTPAEPIHPSAIAPDRVVVTLDWRPAQPVLVGDARESITAQLVPLLTTMPDGRLGPVLPGSSIKGVLRSTAERVVRTIRGVHQVDGDPTNGDRADGDRADGDLPIDELARREPTLAALFGSTERAGALSIPDVTAATGDGDPDTDGSDTGSTDIGSTDVGPAGSEPTVDPGQWLRGETAPPWARARTRVALDRWTGGAADQRLFTALEPRVWNWQPIRLEIDPARLSGNQLRAVLVLLGVTVAELVEGRVGFGRGTSRGLGEIQIATISIAGLPPGFPPFEGGDWWAWLRALANNRELPELLDLPHGGAEDEAMVSA